MLCMPLLESVSSTREDPHAQHYPANLIQSRKAPPGLVEPEVRPNANREAGIKRPGSHAALR
jgi:hypothetical protein